MTKTIDVEAYLTGHPYYPEGRTMFSADFALDGPREQSISHLEAIVIECEQHIAAAPDQWDASYARTLLAEAREYLVELT